MQYSFEMSSLFENLEIVRQFSAAGVTRIHSNEDSTRGDKRDLCPLKLKVFHLKTPTTCTPVFECCQSTLNCCFVLLNVNMFFFRLSTESYPLLLGLLNSGDLLCYYRQHLHINTIKLIKACPGPRAEGGEDKVNNN